MKSLNIQSSLRIAAAVLATAFFLQTLHATPYASGITNSAGTVSFILNESGGNVTVTYQDGSTNANFNGFNTGTNLAKGKYSFALGGNTSYRIAVNKIGSGSPSQISVDSSNACIYPTARGVAVNANPNSPYFGLIYTLNATAGGSGASAKARGIYIYNADTSDAFGRGATASGAVFSSASASSPYRISLGSDDTVYVGDFSTAAATVWKFDPAVSNTGTWTNVLAIIGQTAAIAAGIHGDISGAPRVTGSLAGGNLVLYTADAALGPVYNSINKYVIGSGPLPYSNAPVQLGNTGLGSIAELNSDMALGADGKVFGNLNRASSFTAPNVKVWDTDGVTLLWDSLAASGGTIGVGPDLLDDTRSISVSPDGKFLATLSTANKISVLKLTNGVPDISSLYSFTIGSATGNGRQIAWDIANNIYTMSSGQALLRIYSQGGTTTAISSNNAAGTAGSFQLIEPTDTASVVATTPEASQGSPTPIPGVFNISRTNAANDLTAAMTVNFTLSGTARPGTYNFSGGSATATNTTFTTNNVVTFTTYPLTATNVVITTNIVVVGKVTILANQSSTNITITPVNDGVSRPTNTVVLSLTGGATYSPAVPFNATVTIKNTGPQFLFISSVSAPTMYKRLTNDFGSFVITRWGDVDTNSYTISSLSYAGTAPGAAYVPVGSVTFDPGAVTVTNFITPLIDTTSLVGNRSVIVSLAGGPGYTAGPNTASLTIIDNVNPPATLIYSNALTSADDATNWLVTAANNNMNTNAIDNTIDFGYWLDAANPLASQNGLITLPPSGATNALRITINKNSAQGSGAAAGVNLYLTNQIFSGDYEVRFYLNCALGGNASVTTEGALFGINHTGNGTNWWTGSGIQVGSQPNFNMDGVWYWISSDGGAGAGDYIEYTGLGGTNGNTGSTTLLSKTRTSFTGNFKSPSPYSGVSSGLIGNGSPANALAGGGGYTNAWADVQIKKANNIVTLLINKIPMFTYTNTTVWTNGYLMLGYNDPFSSVGAPDGAAYFSDLTVVALSAPVITLQPSNIVAAAGIPVTFAAKATFGSTALSTNYQWFFNGTAIPGATSTNYSFTAASTNYGTYSWSANDGNVTTLSTNATLTPPLPSIVSVLPATRASVIGGSGTFTVTAITASGVTNVQWLSNSVSIASATSRTLTLANVVAGNFGSIYTVRVNDGTTSITSAPPVTLTLATNQTITSPSWATNRFNLSYGTEFGPNYVVELKTNLLQASWAPVSTNAGTGGILNVTNTTSAAQGFYRLRLQ